jgi:hypothetical protein
MQHPDPVVAALADFVSAPNLFEVMVGYLDNPATPKAVRRVIGDLLVLGDRLGVDWVVA